MGGAGEVRKYNRGVSMNKVPSRYLQKYYNETSLYNLYMLIK
jgi:hypothetical protein